MENTVHHTDNTYLLLAWPDNMWLHDCCVHVCLSVQVIQKPTAHQRQQLAVHSKCMAGCVTELIQTAEAMKGEAATHTFT